MELMQTNFSSMTLISKHWFSQLLFIKTTKLYYYPTIMDTQDSSGGSIAQLEGALFDPGQVTKPVVPNLFFNSQRAPSNFLNV